MWICPKTTLAQSWCWCRQVAAMLLRGKWTCAGTLPSPRLPQDVKLDLQRALGIPPHSMFLCFKGKYLRDATSLASHGLPAPPRPPKLTYKVPRGRRNKRGVQRQALLSPTRKHEPEEEVGAVQGMLSVGGMSRRRRKAHKASLASKDIEEEEGLDGLHEVSGAEGSAPEASGQSPSPQGGGSQGGGSSGQDSDSEGSVTGFFQQEDSASDSEGSREGTGSYIEDGASVLTAATAPESIPLVARCAAAPSLPFSPNPLGSSFKPPSRADMLEGEEEGDRWRPEQVHEQHGDAHRSTVLYLTTSAMVAQQMAKMYTWQVDGSYASAVVAEQVRRDAVNMKAAVRQAQLRSRLQQRGIAV